MTRPGVVLPYASRTLGDSFGGVLDALRVDCAQTPLTQFAELLGRITYLSRGPASNPDGAAYVRKVVCDLEHAGIAGLESEDERVGERDGARAAPNPDLQIP